MHAARHLRYALLSLALVVVFVLAAGCGKQAPTSQSDLGRQGPEASKVPLPPVKEQPAESNRGESATQPEDKLIIFHAAGLARPFADLEKIFEEAHPGVDVQRESGPSVGVARKITDLGRKCDLYAAADYSVISDMLIPDYTDFQLLFLKEHIVVAYTQRSKYASEINSSNWYEILLRPDVSVGYANPAVSPVGWRTLLVWKLAEPYYKQELNGKSLFAQLEAKIPPQNIVPDVQALEPKLESLDLDYAFMYKSTAEQHNLQYVQLPEDIDLSSPSKAAFYAKATVQVKGKDGKTKLRKGGPIVFSITQLKDAEHPRLASEWLKLMFSKQGQEVFKQDFMETLYPPLAPDVSKVPAELQRLVKPLEKAL